MTKRAILYARVSGDDRNNATSSIKGQLAECRHYAESRGYSVVEEAIEEPNRPTSGYDMLPELERLLKLAPSHTFDVIICREVDRLARNRFKQMATEIELENHGVMVEYVVGQFENSDEGRLLKGLVSEFAEYERSKIRRRTHSGKMRSVASGNVAIGGSGAPYGYEAVVVNGKRTLAINEEEAAVVRQIFHLYVAELTSVYSIGAYLDAHKIPTPTRGNNHKRVRKYSKWTIATINNLLENEIYIGRWYYRKTQPVKSKTTGRASNMPRPREEWLQVPVPAIISEELFEAARQRKEANKRQMGHQRRHQYTLGGMLHCGRCGMFMCGMTKHYRRATDNQDAQYAYYKCNAHHQPKKFEYRCDLAPFKASLVDGAVWAWVKSLLLEPEVLRRSIEAYQEQQYQRVQPQLAMLASSQTRLSELEGQKERLIAAYSKGVLSLDELASQKAILDKQITDLGQAVAALRAEAEPNLMTAEQVETIEGIAAEIRQGAALADDDKQIQRSIFQLLEVSVTLDHDEERRWADVTCKLGNQRCAVEYTTTQGNHNDTGHSHRHQRDQTR